MTHRLTEEFLHVFRRVKIDQIDFNTGHEMGLLCQN